MLIHINGLTTLLFAWSFVYVHAYVASIISELYPLFAIILLSTTTRGEYRGGKKIIFLNVVAILAVSLIVIADTTGSTSSHSFDLQYIFGLVLLAISLIFTLQSSPLIVRQGQEFARNIFGKDSNHIQEKEEYTAIFLRIFASLVIVVIGSITFAIFETFNLFQSFSGTINIWGIIIAIAGGITIRAIGGITTIKGHRDKDLGSQIARYLTPVFGIIFLVSFLPLRNILPNLDENLPIISDINWILFFIGLFGVLFVNVAIKFKRKN